MSEPIFYNEPLKRVNRRFTKRIKSEYKGVELRIAKDGTQRWVARMVNQNSRSFDTEREAAIAVDKNRILNGLSPVNVLKPKPEQFWCAKTDQQESKPVCKQQCNECKSS